MNLPKAVQTMKQVVPQIAEGYALRGVSLPEREKLRRCAEELNKACSDVPPAWRPAIRYHQARFLALAGAQDEAMRWIDDLVKETPLPEALWLKIQLSASGDDAESGRRRWQLEEQLGKQLPLSAWGRLRDAALERQEGERVGALSADSPRPAIPRTNRDDLIRIAGLYADMSLVADAANAQREAIYAGFSPPGFPVLGDETWIGPATAEWWMKAARWEAMLGKQGWAVQALLMGVASSPQQAAAAGAVLDQIALGESKVPKSVPKEEGLYEIAELYVRNRLHPRGAAALDQAAASTKADVGARRQMLVTQWGGLLEEYSAGRRKTAHLFGHLVDKAGDPLTVAPARFPY